MSQLTQEKHSRDQSQLHFLDFLSQNLSIAMVTGTLGDQAAMFELVARLSGVKLYASKVNGANWPAHNSLDQAEMLDTQLFVDVQTKLHQAGITSAQKDRGALGNLIFPGLLQLNGSKILVPEFVEQMVQLLAKVSKQKDPEADRPIVLMSGLIFHLLGSLVTDPFNINVLLHHPYPLFDQGLVNTPPQFVPKFVSKMVGEGNQAILHRALGAAMYRMVTPQTAATVWKMIPDEFKSTEFQARFEHSKTLVDPAKQELVIARIYNNQTDPKLGIRDHQQGLFEMPTILPQLEGLALPARTKILEMRKNGRNIILFTTGSMQLGISTAAVTSMLNRAATEYNDLVSSSKTIFFVQVDSQATADPGFSEYEPNVLVISPAAYADISPEAAIIHGGTQTVNDLKALKTPTSTLWFLPEQATNSLRLGKNLVSSYPAAEFNEQLLTNIIRDLAPRANHIHEHVDPEEQRAENDAAIMSTLRTFSTAIQNYQLRRKKSRS